MLERHSESSVSTIGRLRKAVYFWRMKSLRDRFPFVRWASCLLVLGSLLSAGQAAGEVMVELGANANESITRLEPALLDRSHTTWVRGFLPASQFITGKRSTANDADVESLKECALAGRKVILTIKWDLMLAKWRVPAADSEEEKR